MKLGLVTYNLARNWGLEKIIELCSKTGFEAVELRTTHAHGVEPTIGPEERRRVRELFESSPVRLLSLGTACEYHSPDRAEVQRNIELTKAFVKLAYDVGALGVKVRPNRLMEDRGIPREKTLKQIGEALKPCGDYAREYGVEIWVEVHGYGTSDPACMRRIMEIADHPQVGICWNSNPTDLIDGSVRESFEMLKDWIRSVHIHELYDKNYPYKELFNLLKGIGYDRYCLAEIPESAEPERLMRYYRALWEELTK
ncbi:sugar phosphate isomerase/epimerase [Candidatus Bathyarchaeota archaeon]|nr:sugar phosphate isomerase/epimerase [Candidatus Bathyarchaeota archaeon]